MGRIGATFAGFPLLGASFTRSLGAKPNVNRLTFAVSGRCILPTSGDLMLTDGTDTLMILEQYPFVTEDNRSGQQGRHWVAEIKDVRWKWESVFVTQQYNMMARDGRPVIDTPIEDIVTDLFTYVGVTPDTSILTPAGIGSNVYPQNVEFQGVAASTAIDELLSKYGYAVWLGPDNAVTIIRLGYGANPSTANSIKYNYGTRLAFPYNSVLIRGNRHIVQRTCHLYPVGLDTDATVRPLAQLSYARDQADVMGGFWLDPVHVDDDTFEDLPNDEQACAKESVGRWWQVPGNHLPYMPMLSYLAEYNSFYTFSGQQIITDNPPILLSDSDLDLTGPVKKVVRHLGNVFEKVTPDYQIDQQLGIVKFPEQQISYAAGTGERLLPGYMLTYAHESRAFGQQAQIDQHGTGTLTDKDFFESYYTPTPNADPVQTVLKIEEKDMRLRVIIPGVDGPDSGATYLNKTDLVEFADELADIALRDQTVITSYESEQPIIFDAAPSGLVRSVEWTVQEKGAWTIFHINNEHSTGVRPTWAERHWIARSLALRDEVGSIEALRREQEADNQ